VKRSTEGDAAEAAAGSSRGSVRPARRAGRSQQIGEQVGSRTRCAVARRADLAPQAQRSIAPGTAGGPPRPVPIGRKRRRAFSQPACPEQARLPRPGRGEHRGGCPAAPHHGLALAQVLQKFHHQGGRKVLSCRGNRLAIRAAAALGRSGRHAAQGRTSKARRRRATFTRRWPSADGSIGSKWPLPGATEPAPGTARFAPGRCYARSRIQDGIIRQPAAAGGDRGAGS